MQENARKTSCKDKKEAPQGQKGTGKQYGTFVLAGRLIVGRNVGETPTLQPT